MIRIAVFLGCLATLGACAGGTQYSSQRAAQPQATYTPATPILTEPVAITPGATPILTEPVAVTPGATPILTEPVAITPGATPILTDPVAVTPGATPVDVTASAPAVSVKPQPRTGVQARVVQASAPAATPVRAVRRSARGPIYSACKSSGRQAASSSRCGCVQWVADRELTKAQQRRGAGYFKNRQGLQDTRQSDRAGDREFWDVWKAFGQSAASQCGGT